MEYIGEHLLPGQIGQFLLVLSFVASILATAAYFFATQRRETTEYKGLRNIGRIAFGLHSFSILGIIGIIFYLMSNQYYEYQYVWAHVSEDLPTQYILSAFWEGQEGSFLLWMFWHIILGGFLIFRAGSWETPVMAILAGVEIFISSMILGLYFDFGFVDFKIGSSPLLLLRDVMEAPIFANADYLELIKGQGLNPLLQNYWMTIHPPTLFLGFASTVVPFGYAVAGLWTNRHKEWLTAVLPWALFSGAILGTGILMGGAWAYEALSFGGYWAWDPVENASLVPWLILIAGIHTNLIAKNTGYSIKSTYIFYLLSFLLIVYSTFLTRSGILGETSVHAFTEMGLEWQLILFMAAFLGVGIGLTAAKWKQIPTPVKEESTGSKEFWMFIGTLVLLFSSALITASTSLPVFNKIMQFFDPMYDGRTITDPVPHYNKYQLWIGVFMGLLAGIAQYLRYKEFNWSGNKSNFIKHSLIAVGISAALTVLFSYWIAANAWQYKLLLFSGLFAVVTNIDYLFSFVKGNMKMAGSAIAHIGFGLMIIGVLASGLNKEFVSQNPFAQTGLIEGFSDEDYKRNIILLKGEPMLMSGYEVTYLEDSIETFTRTFKINYKKKNDEGEVIEDFHLYPNVLYDKSFKKIAASNPSTKHYLHKDIFTHIASLPKTEVDFEFAQQMEDSLDYESFEMNIGDTIYTKAYYAILEKVNTQPSHPDYRPHEGDMTLGVRLAIKQLKDPKTWYAEPMLAVNKNMLYGFPAELNDLNMKVRMNEESLRRYFSEQELDFQEHIMKEGDQFYLNGRQITFKGFIPNPSHPNYEKEEGDIAVAANLDVLDTKTGKRYQARPVYVIRESKQYNIQDEVGELGFFFRFTNINPNEKNVRIEVATGNAIGKKLVIEVAENTLRTDYIVLEAIVFPGINFFWLGTIMMMLGLAFSWIVRLQNKKALESA